VRRAWQTRHWFQTACCIQTNRRGQSCPRLLGKDRSTASHGTRWAVPGAYVSAFLTVLNFAFAFVPTA
jgi:hypothetical protein